MITRAVKRALVALLFPVVLFSAQLEIGTVRRTDDGAFTKNVIPALARLADGRLMVVWSARAKGQPYRVVAAVSADGGRTWSDPKTVIQTGMDDLDPNMLVDGARVFVYSTTVPLNPKRIETSTIFVARSEDKGETWSGSQEIHLPMKYVVGKQHNAIKLLDGSYAMAISWDLWAEKGVPASTEGEMNLASGLLRSKDGIEWRRFGFLHKWVEKVRPGATGGLCEPSLVQLRDGELLMILRAGGHYHYESRSRDGGITWDDPRPSPLMGHNTPTSLWRLDDRPDEIIAVWNNSPLHRYPLSAAISADGGRTWSRPRNIATSEGRQLSYPGVTQDSAGTFVVVWQEDMPGGGRGIRTARFTRDWVLEREAP